MISLSERDMKWLRVGTSRSGVLGQVVLGVTPLLYLGLSGFHFWIASLWAHRDGLTFAEAWHGWLAGIHPDRDYPGVYLKAMEQFDAGAVAATFALFFGLGWWMHRADLRRRTRLRALIEGAA